MNISVSQAPFRACLAVGFILVMCVPGLAFGQSARVNGYVTDASDGQALELVNVAVEDAGGELRGVVTDRDGRYLIVRLTPGRYTLRVSFIGYQTFSASLDLSPGEVRTVNVALAPDTEQLDEVLVESERTGGAARVTAGQQTVRPADIALIPAPDLSGDLVSYLTSQPGVVATGDRGGQLFIRGGEPSQNLVQLDGMLLYQPFHVLGFYSAFPSDIINRADLYAGGYGSRFGERISSVIDVWTREGNKRRLAGSASISPFISALQLEGPLLSDRFSLLTSVRRSMVEQGAERLIDRRLPFDFWDAFARLHGNLSSRSRLSVSAIRTYDRGTLHEELGGTPPDEVRWKNQGASLRYVGLPSIVAATVAVRLAYSRLDTEQGPPEAPEKSSHIESTQLALDATFTGEQVDVDAGLAFRAISTGSILGGQFQNLESRGYTTSHFAFYLEPEFTFGDFLFRPGARLEFFHVRVEPFVEPRLRLIWSRGIHQVSAAAGLYHQEEVGLTDRRDAASIYTAWTIIPKKNLGESEILYRRIPTAIHAILGYRVTPSEWLEVSVEGFYKDMDNLFVPEWTSYPRLITRLQPASGRSGGFDARIELRRDPFTAYVNYGYSSTLYWAGQSTIDLWYGRPELRYRPPHDRRHQVNAVVNARLAGFDLSARWEFGSGLPFTRPIGFDGFVLVDDVYINPSSPSSDRVIYERPYNAELPTYHRLDVSVERTFDFGAVDLTLLGSLINTYDRRNIFYVDLFTLQRVDQLPFIPSFGLKVAFN